MATGDEILGWIKAAQEEEAIERTECPICAWPLKKHPDGTLHCPFGHWQSQQRLRRFGISRRGISR